MSTRRLTDAARRAGLEAHRVSHPPFLNLAATACAFVGFVFVTSLDLILVWEFPEQTPATFPGVARYADMLIATSGAWTALVLTLIVGHATDPARRGGKGFVVLGAALALSVLLILHAWQHHEVASWPQGAAVQGIALSNAILGITP